MSNPILDYKPQVKNLINEYYAPPIPGDRNVVVMTLADLHYKLMQVMPKESITENELYEVLIELGYKPTQEKLKVLTPPVSMLSENDDMPDVSAIDGTEQYTAYIELGYLPTGKYRPLFVWKFNSQLAKSE